MRPNSTPESGFGRRTQAGGANAVCRSHKVASMTTDLGLEVKFANGQDVTRQQFTACDGASLPTIFPVMAIIVLR